MNVTGLFSWFLGRRNPWNCWSDKSVFVIHEPVGSYLSLWLEMRWLRMIVWKTNHVIRRSGLWVPPPHPPKAGERPGDRVQSHVQCSNQPCLGKGTPITTLDTKAQYSFLAGRYTDMPRGWLHGERHGSSGLKSELTLLIPSFGLSWFYPL